MITSKDILEKTGLKTAKTLTRWHQRGLIPEPLVRTHPSGRGKVSYWPDWVLDRCLRVVELQREGHSLQSAAGVLAVERLGQKVDRAKEEPRISDVLAGKQTQLTPEREGTLLEVFTLAMFSTIKRHVADPTERATLLAQFKEAGLVDVAFDMARAGYNPVLVYDGERPEVVPDFLVAQRLSSNAPDPAALVVAPLLPTLCKLFPWLEPLVGTSPAAWPAPKIWVREGDAVVEYVFSPTGPVGFEVIRESSKVVSRITEEEEIDEDANRDA